MATGKRKSSADDSKPATAGSESTIDESGTATDTGESGSADYRPTGNDSNGIPTVSPESIAENTPKRRGRKPGSTNSGNTGTSGGSGPKANKTDSIAGIAQILVLVHGSIAAFTNKEEIEIDLNESKKIAEALVNLGAQYEIKPNPKVIAWTNFAAVCGEVYGPRLMAAGVSFKIKKSGE